MGEVEGLKALWVLTERPTTMAVARMANFHASEATASIEVPRKRGASAIASDPWTTAHTYIPSLELDGPLSVQLSLVSRATPHARAKAEAQARDLALASLLELVVHSKLPAVTALSPGASPSALLECIGHGKLASTIVERVRAWRKASQYFELLHGRPWPTDLSMVLGWLRKLGASFLGLRCKQEQKH